MFLKNIYFYVFSWLCWVLAVAFEPSAAACGVLFPDQRSNLGPLRWEHRVLATGPPGQSHEPLLNDIPVKLRPRLGGMSE